MGDSIVRSFCRGLITPPTSLCDEFHYSAATTPSKRYDRTVKKLCSVHWSKVPDFYSLPTWRNPKGRVIRRLSFDLKMTSNGVTLDFEIVYKGQIMGSQKIGIDHSVKKSVEDSDRDDDAEIEAMVDALFS